MSTQVGDRKKKPTRPVPLKSKGRAAKKSLLVRVKKAPAVKVTAAPEKADLTEVRLKGGLTRKLFARMTGFSERAIASWEAGDPVSEAAKRRLLETERFRQRLAEIVKPEAIPVWLDTPNDAFNGLKPVEVIERGEIDRLWNMIFYLESGVAS